MNVLVILILFILISGGVGWTTNSLNVTLSTVVTLLLIAFLLNWFGII